jgi:hypothetical protein
MWEYKIVTLNPYNASENSFNALGREGWELAEVVPLSFAGISEEMQYIFKRHIANK